MLPILGALADSDFHPDVTDVRPFSTLHDS